MSALDKRVASSIISGEAGDYKEAKRHQDDVRLSPLRADWLTYRGNPKELHQDSNWWNGLPILYKPVEGWGLKSGLQKEEALPGEKKSSMADPPLIVYERFSDINSVIWVVTKYGSELLVSSTLSFTLEPAHIRHKIGF